MNTRNLLALSLIFFLSSCSTWSYKPLRRIPDFSSQLNRERAILFIPASGKYISPFATGCEDVDENKEITHLNYLFKRYFSNNNLKVVEIDTGKFSLDFFKIFNTKLRKNALKLNQKYLSDYLTISVSDTNYFNLLFKKYGIRYSIFKLDVSVACPDLRYDNSPAQVYGNISFEIWDLKEKKLIAELVGRGSAGQIYESRRYDRFAVSKAVFDAYEDFKIVAGLPFE